jgi:hypothetical protein
MKTVTKRERARLLRLPKAELVDEIVKLVQLVQERIPKGEFEHLTDEKARLQDRLDRSVEFGVGLEQRARQADEEAGKLYQQISELNGNLRRERLIVNKLVGW